MHTPRKNQWQAVIDNFVSVLPLAKSNANLRMTETLVKSTWHICGTVHCVAGWYFIAKRGTEHEDVEYIGYKQGAILMAEDLGFSAIGELEKWAANNPGTWGNPNGEYMFSCEDAYNGAKNINDVIQFLTNVRDRSPE